MRIAQVSPLIERVPPSGYGGTERVVSGLTEELVALGHHVTLFASGDSLTSAELVACSPRALRNEAKLGDPILHYMCMLDEVWRRRDEFDVLHFHIDTLHFPLFRPVAARTLTTLHGRQDLPHLAEVYRRFAAFPLVSISDHQRRAQPQANFVATVYHGIALDLFAPVLQPRGGYLAFLGRISPEKGVDKAIAIALGAGLPLKIAAKVDLVDRAYFKEVVAPLLQLPGIEYVGEIGDQQKQRFLGDALAVLFPVEWPEPFGLVMIEAMACGSPVLAFRNGSVPEVVKQGVSGIVVGSVEEAVAALPCLLCLDRGGVRREVERRFGARRMAWDYIELYERTVARASGRRPRSLASVSTAAVPSPKPDKRPSLEVLGPASSS